MKFIDLHCDTILALMHNNSNIKDALTMVNIDKLKQADYLLQCFAMFVKLEDNNGKLANPFEYCDKMIDRYYDTINQNLDVIKPIYTYQDIENNMQNNIISSLLSIEEGGTCLGKLENLEHFYQRGVRMLTITWNFKNELASPNLNYNKTNNFSRLNIKDITKMIDTENGLTETGISFVKKMNELGMVIDCSHASDKTFYDCIKYSTKPIICSHSCCRSICDFPRNITDDMLYKLKENGGLIGINFCHDFVISENRLCLIEDVVKHINHVVKTIGIDYVGLGSDFDGIDNSNIELKDATYMPKLVEALKKAGYSTLDIDKITHLNVLRVLKANLK